MAAVPPTIFVSIPSYRDPECQWTIHSLFHQARHPDRIFVGTCIQYNPAEDQHCFGARGSGHGRPAQVRQLCIPWHQAAGPMYARALAQSLYNGEQRYLQIDSHMRFTEGWDEELEGMLEAARQAGSSKPVITTYPSGYDRGQPLPQDRRPNLLCAKSFEAKDKMLRITGRPLAANSATPLPSRFWAAGFAYSDGSAVTEVPYDQRLRNVFFGEESVMAARLWTHGYDFFAPTHAVIFHLWSRSYRPTFREVTVTAAHQQDEKEARAKIYRFLGMDVDKAQATAPETAASPQDTRMGLGNARSFQAFQQFTGVNWREQTISQAALDGGVDAALFRSQDAGKAVLALLSAMMQGQ